MVRCVWDDIVGQPKVATFLKRITTDRAVGHAYLFVGPPGSGKKTAALALACAVFCDDGCGACPSCTRIRRRTHPDVHLIEPEGSAGYLIEQVRQVIHDVSLAPVEGPRKVYIFDSADLFNESSASAFLKTLEEPPDDVLIVLLAHSYERVLPTVASRCQVVRFRRIPPAEAAAVLVERTGAGPDEALAALAAAGGVAARAKDFLGSPSRRAARTLVMRELKDLAAMDEYDVLVAAKGLLSAVKAPLEDVKLAQAAEVAAQSDFLGRGASKSLEDRHKRELTAREREGIGEVLNVAESWLRDCLTISQGVGDLAVNRDALDAMEEVGAVMTPAAAAASLGAVNEARRLISYNVSPQLAVEAMLFDLREVLRCPR